jgi:phosphoglycerate dehydrogenase-like enzyme
MRLLFSLALLSTFALSAQTKKIVITNADPQMLQTLSGASTKVRLVNATPSTLMTELADADAFIGEPTPEMVRAGKKLKWVQIMSAGAEKVLFLSGGNDLRDSDIVLTNNRIVQGPEIADHALALLLTLTRGINHFIADDKNETWDPRNYKGIELNGKTAVIIGMGGIGQQIATRAWAFGMNVIGVDPQDYPISPFVKRMVKPDQLDDVLPEADVLFISAPHTEQSHKMVGAKEFGLLKKGSYFIAVSRGGVYDMPGLVKALDEQRLAGAGVDVVDPEPLPKGHPLWKFNNAIVTPHIAGRSDRDRARMVNTIRDNIARFADGKPLLNVVNKQRGF